MRVRLLQFVVLYHLSVSCWFQVLVAQAEHFVSFVWFIGVDDTCFLCYFTLLCFMYCCPAPVYPLSVCSPYMSLWFRTYLFVPFLVSGIDGLPHCAFFVFFCFRCCWPTSLYPLSGFCFRCCWPTPLYPLSGLWE